jgi:FAD:protein FMN transferase
MNKSMAILGCLLVMMIPTARVYAKELASFSGQTMGTRYRVTVVGEPSPDLQSKIETRLAGINSLMSTYDPDSELSQFNHLKQQMSSDLPCRFLSRRMAPSIQQLVPR